MLHWLSPIPNTGYRLSDKEKGPQPLSPRLRLLFVSPCSSSYEGRVFMATEYRGSLWVPRVQKRRPPNPLPNTYAKRPLWGWECVPRAHPRAFKPFNSLRVAAKESEPQTQGRGT